MRQHLSLFCGFLEAGGENFFLLAGMMLKSVSLCLVDLRVGNGRPAADAREEGGLVKEDTVTIPGLIRDVPLEAPT